VIYSYEHERRKAMREVLQDLLGFPIVQTVQTEGSSNDGIADMTWDKNNKALLALFEYKNEVGAGSGDPALQASSSYRKWAVDSANDSIRNSSCCPAFIVSIAGPHVCISGAVFIDCTMVQMLIEPLVLNLSPALPNRLRRVAKIFAALSRALHQLRDFYHSVTPSPSYADHRLPCYRSYTANSPLPDFRYLGPTEGRVCLFEAEARPVAGAHKLVVKFTSRYNELAHRLLAEEGLAPKLYGVASCGGDLKCIMMAKINGRTLHQHGMADASIYADIKRAVELLHANNLVFGDLRSPNIMVYQRDGKNHAMLVDFDWCGLHDQACYTEGLNPDLAWASGVTSGGLMRKEHDLELLSRLLDQIAVD